MAPGIRSFFKNETKNVSKPVKSIYTKFKNHTCFAFDFGEFALKIVQAKVTKEKVEIKNVFFIENEDRKFNLDEVTIKELRKKIVKLFGKKNIDVAGYPALCVVGAKSYIGRELEIPYAQESDRQGLVASEMGQLLSLDIDAYVFQHEVLEQFEANGIQMCKVWAAAISKDYCDMLYRLFSSLKMKPMVMDIAVNGIKRLIEADNSISTLAGDTSVAFVDYGMNSTDVFVFKNGTYSYGTSVSFGDNRVVSSARDVLGISAVDIHNPNKLAISPQRVYDILRDASQSDGAAAFMKNIEEWLTATDEVVKRYNMENPDYPVSRAFIYGGSHQMSWLSKYLEKYMNVPVTVLDNLSCFNVKSKGIDLGAIMPQILNAANLLLIR